MKNSPALATLAHVGRHHQIQCIEVLVSDSQSQYTNSYSNSSRGSQLLRVLVRVQSFYLKWTWSWTSHFVYRGRRNCPSCSSWDQWTLQKLWRYLLVFAEEQWVVVVKGSYLQPSAYRLVSAPKQCWLLKKKHCHQLLLLLFCWLMNIGTSWR